MPVIIMRRVLQIFPALLLFFVLKYGIIIPSAAAPATLKCYLGSFQSAPATNPDGLVAPPEGGKMHCSNVNSPPFRGPGGQKQPYTDSFRGPLASLSASGDQRSETVKIGLLIQDSSSFEARNGAEMAIDEANKKGGFDGGKFVLIVKSMEGPWGTGSKQAVDMIFRDEVAGILGSHDGRNAHLVEQATTKSHIAFLSAWTGDPTLSQAFTPWYFSCVPNNTVQGRILAGIARDKTSVIIVTDEDYDAQSAFKEFRSAMGKDFPSLYVKNIAGRPDYDIAALCELIKARHTGVVILFTDPENAGSILSRIEDMKPAPEVYGPLSLLAESSPVCYHQPAIENILELSSGNWYREKLSAFAVKYYERYGKWPGAMAAYAYDAANVMIEAVVKAEGDRSLVYKTLMTVKHNGVTGSFYFDEKGNRINN